MSVAYLRVDTIELGAASTQYTADRTIIAGDDTVSSNRSGVSAINLYVEENRTVSLDIVDEDGVAVSMVGKTLQITFTMVADRLQTVVVPAADITISTSIIEFDAPFELTTQQSIWRWALRDLADSMVYAQGICNVSYTAVEV